MIDPNEPLDEWGRQPVNVATRLRALAEKVEKGHLGALALADIGEVFGNEFWLLFNYDDGQRTMKLDADQFVALCDVIRGVK